MNRYQKALFYLLCFYLAVPCLTMALNYAVDPFDRYHVGVKRGELAELAGSSDKLLLVPSNYEDRILVRKMIESREKPTAVLLGGSRIMNLHGGMVRPEERRGFFNAGVSAGTLSDYAALWQLMKKRSKVPDRIYLEIDAQAVYSNFSDDFSWSPNACAYFEFKLSGTGKKKFKRVFKSARRLARMHLTRLTSWEWTSRSLEKKSLDRLPFKLIQVRDYDGVSPARTPSFGLLYGKPSHAITREFLEEWGQKNGIGEASYFSDPGAFSEDAFLELSALVRDMASRGVRLTVFIPPSSPKSYETVSGLPQARKGMLDFIARVREISTAAGASFYDGLEQNHGLVSTMDFVDGVHLNPQANRKLMTRVDAVSGTSLFEIN